MQRRARAAVLYGREDVRIEAIDVPVPGPGEVLLRVEAALTCATDAKVYRRGYHARMIRPPAVFGHEAAGVVEQVGEGAEGFQPGDAVVAANSAPCRNCDDCRRGRTNLCENLLFWNGAYAEIARIPARIVKENLLHRPAGLSAHKAAMIEPLACAIHGLEVCGVRPGDQVAIIGVGPLGLMLLMLAMKRGAEVISVGRRTEGLNRARALGAHEVLSVLDENIEQRLLEISPNGRGFDVVIEAVGRPETAEVALAVVRKGGLVNLFGGCATETRISLNIEKLHYQEIRIMGSFHHTPEKIREALKLLADGEIDAELFLCGEATLRDLPHVLQEMSTGSRSLKTVVRP